MVRPDQSHTAYFDPANSNYGGVCGAVINTYWGNDNRNREFLTLSRMIIQGPPAFNSWLPGPGDDFHVYVGEPAIPLVLRDCSIIVGRFCGPPERKLNS